MQKFLIFFISLQIYANRSVAVHPKFLIFTQIQAMPGRFLLTVPGRFLLIGFFAIQILVDLGHSVTAYPFVHYGMFSESFAQPDSLTVFTITADGQSLQPGDFAIYRWDQVQNPLLAFDRQVSTRDFAFDKEKLQKGMHFIGAGSLYPLLLSNLNNTEITATRFASWYKTYLSSLIGRPIHSLRVDKSWYRYDGAHFVLVKTDHRINL